MELYQHYKNGRIFHVLYETVAIDEVPENSESINLTMHNNQENIITFYKQGETMYTLDDDTFIIYQCTEENENLRVRRHDDFFSKTTNSKGDVVNRFQKVEKNDADDRDSDMTVVKESNERGVIDVYDVEKSEMKEEEITPLNNFEQLNEQEGKYVRPEVDIEMPENHLQLVNKTLHAYKQFLEKDEYLETKIAYSETEESAKELEKERTDFFKTRYAGMLAKDDQKRLSVSAVRNIWDKFIRDEYRSFLRAHVNLTMHNLLTIGIDKFIYTMGWTKPTDVATWHNNKLRIGVCCHCQDQFLPMMLQFNHGLCNNCRPKFSSKAIRKFITRQTEQSERYAGAESDLLMDFYIMFYHDNRFRSLFIDGTDSAKEMENFKTAEDNLTK